MGAPQGRPSRKPIAPTATGRGMVRNPTEHEHRGWSRGALLRFVWTLVSAFFVESLVFALAALPAVAFFRWHTTWSIEPTYLTVDTIDADAVGRRIAPLALSAGVRLTEVAPLDDDLESVFRYLVEGR